MLQDTSGRLFRPWHAICSTSGKSIFFCGRATSRCRSVQVRSKTRGEINITRLEIFNLKDHAAGKTAHIAEISQLQEAINEGSAIRLKQIIREIIDRIKHAGAEADARQVDKLVTILYDIDILKSYYICKPLKSRIGSDSTGRSSKTH